MFAALDMVLEDIIKNNNKYAFIILPGAEVDPQDLEPLIISPTVLPIVPHHLLLLRH